MFPVSNSSQTIIECFLNATQKLGIEVLTGQSVQSLFKKETVWKIETQNENYILLKINPCYRKQPQIWE
jgi:predicted flavoprotein YhiN